MLYIVATLAYLVLMIHCGCSGSVRFFYYTSGSNPAEPKKFRRIYSEVRSSAILKHHLLTSAASHYVIPNLFKQPLEGDHSPLVCP